MALSKKSEKVLSNLFGQHSKGKSPTAKELRALFDEVDGGTYRKGKGSNIHFSRRGHSVTLGLAARETRASMGEIKKMLSDLNPNRS